MEETRTLERRRGQYVLTVRSQDTIEKCYKIHGYLPGYKSRARPAANQVTASTLGHYDGNASLSITSKQCQPLISFLNSQMANEASTSTHQAAAVISHPPNFSGILHHSKIIHNAKHIIFSVKNVNINAFSNDT